MGSGTKLLWNITSACRRSTAAGDSILLEIDQQGAAQIKEQMPDAISIFILPPDMIIERRLRRRGTDLKKLSKEDPKKLKDNSTTVVI